MLVLNFPAFENKKYTAHDRFHGNGPYGKIPTKKEPIRTLGFALPYNNLHYCYKITKHAKSKNRMQIIGTPLESDNIGVF